MCLLKMRIIVFVAFCLAVATAVPKVSVRDDGDDDGDVSEVAKPCTDEVCKIEEGCRCSSAKSPLEKGTQPQLVSLTFDESVTDEIYKQYWEPLLFSRVNPDGVPIGATFFVPHIYTDYERVNDLYNYGFEIAVHSVTKNPLQKYWRDASTELLEQEFGDQKKIIANFANIPLEHILGVRTPQLQLAGNYSPRAFVNSNLTYDSSWPTLPSKPLYPYTLDYLSTQECSLGAACPNEQFKGFWILPITDITSTNNTECNTLSSCNVEGTVEEITEWLLGQILSVRNSTKVPLTLIVESHWFDKTPNSLKAFSNVLDELAKFEDVFLVTQQQILDWIKKPVPVEEFKTEEPERAANCRPVTCKLVDENGEARYMKSCVSCPKEYPWLGNPLGLSDNI